MKEKIHQLSKARNQALTMPPSTQMSPIVRMESNLESEALSEARLDLRERSKGLVKDLVDSTQAFDKTVKGYDAVISVEKEAPIEKR